LPTGSGTDKKLKEQHINKNDTMKIGGLILDDSTTPLRSVMKPVSSHGMREMSPAKSLADMRAMMKSKKHAEIINESNNLDTTQDKLNQKIDDLENEFKKHRNQSEDRSPQKRHA
jgi:hypothetical protein